jgi:hypothetical protein
VRLPSPGNRRGRLKTSLVVQARCLYHQIFFDLRWRHGGIGFQPVPFETASRIPRLKPTANAEFESPSGDFFATQPGNSFPGRRTATKRLTTKTGTKGLEDPIVTESRRTDALRASLRRFRRGGRPDARPPAAGSPFHPRLPERAEAPARHRRQDTPWHARGSSRPQCGRGRSKECLRLAVKPAHRFAAHNVDGSFVQSRTASARASRTIRLSAGGRSFRKEVHRTNGQLNHEIQLML